VLNIHAILLTTFQTSLSPFIFLDLRRFCSPTFHRHGACGGGVSLSPSLFLFRAREIKFRSIILSLQITRHLVRLITEWGSSRGFLALADSPVDKFLRDRRCVTRTAQLTCKSNFDSFRCCNDVTSRTMTKRIVEALVTHSVAPSAT